MKYYFLKRSLVHSASLYIHKASGILWWMNMQFLLPNPNNANDLVY